MELTTSQNEALGKLLEAIDAGCPLVTLAGSAGTGKTTLIKKLRDRLLDGRRYSSFSDSLVETDDLRDVIVATPTNKAAQVLCKKGITAATFFKTFYLLQEETKDTRGNNQPVFVSCRRWVEDTLRSVTNNDTREELINQIIGKGKAVEADVLIIDEASLLTHKRIREMQAMCQTLVLVGDHHQLPPVGDREYPEGYFSEIQHTAVLTEIMRQAEGSAILGLADELRRNGPMVEALIDSFEPAESFLDLVRRGAQIIAFTNKERQRINHICRKILGRLGPLPMEGDMVLVTNNFSDELINGTVVEVTGFKWDGRAPSADIVLVVGGRETSFQMCMRTFGKDQIASAQEQILEGIPDHVQQEGKDPLLELTYAYCMTAHKSQGSEWETVVVIDQRSLIKKIQAGDINARALSPEEYARRWTYTAITRAKKNLIIAPTWFAKSYE